MKKTYLFTPAFLGLALALGMVASNVQAEEVIAVAADSDVDGTMTWESEGYVATDTNGTSKSDYELYEPGTTNSVPIQSSRNVEEAYGDFLHTDAEYEANIPNYFDQMLGLTGYRSTVADSFTITSAGEKVTMDQPFMLHMPYINYYHTSGSQYNGGSLFVQEIDEAGVPAGTIYEIDGSQYTPIEGGNSFVIPCVIDGVEGVYTFTKQSGVAEITDAVFTPTLSNGDEGSQAGDSGIVAPKTGDPGIVAPIVGATLSGLALISRKKKQTF